MRIAIIDLGTNTCNLMVAEITGNNYNILHQSKQLVKLGDDKIKAGVISSEATDRVITAFQIQQEIINRFNAGKIVVIATSAVRTATNRSDFIKRITCFNNWNVEVVSGGKEAELIYKGVVLAFGFQEKPVVILDIGGGSNEIIISCNKRIQWKESKPAGMARIINNFQISDPIKKAEIDLLRGFFAEMHSDAFLKIKEWKIETLIGCSGVFDTIADIIDEVNPGEKTRKTQIIRLADFYTVFDRLLFSTNAERLQMKGMDLVRIDLIVPAVILIEYLISETEICEIIQTDFALREGILFELLNKENEITYKSDKIGSDSKIFIKRK